MVGQQGTECFKSLNFSYTCSSPREQRKSVHRSEGTPVSRYGQWWEVGWGRSGPVVLTKYGTDLPTVKGFQGSPLPSKIPLIYFFFFRTLPTQVCRLLMTPPSPSPLRTT